MEIIPSGLNVPPKGGNMAVTDVDHLSADADAVHTVVNPVEPTPFVFLFPELQSDEYRVLGLPGTGTENALKNLGDTMRDPGLPTATKGIPDSGIPSAYTYFGQFVDHDITFEDPTTVVPMNKRSPNLDLDSVYGIGSAKGEGDLMKLDVEFDLPRTQHLVNDRGREAEIPDPRNDENLIIAQLHVAFLRAHNKAVKQLNLDFEAARKLIVQHYQSIVLYDFLKKVADPVIVDKITEKNEFFFPADPVCMPVEFSLAAFRFGHSMVRAGYNNFNTTIGNATIEMLFAFTGSGGFMGNNILPESWIINWKSFLDVGEEFNSARRIDTTLVTPLFDIPAQHLSGLQLEVRLSVRNLIRGYNRKLPTGQAVAERMKIPALTEKEIRGVAKEVSHDQYDQLKAVEEAQLTTRTPLWYYILAEAANYKKGCLGPVGSTLVAEVLIGILRRSKHSILGPEYTKENPWKPSLPCKTEGKFYLSDFLEFAGVLS